MYNSHKKEKTITEKILLFQKLGTGYEDIFKELSLKTYRYPEYRKSRAEDDAGDFYLFFLPKIKQLIIKFIYHGIPFEHYFNSTLSKAYKSFKDIKNRQKVIYNFTKSEDFYMDFINNDYEDIYKDINFSNNFKKEYRYFYIDNIPEKTRFLLKIDTNNKIKKSSIKYRLILLALKFAHFLDKYKIDFIIFITGINESWFLLKINDAIKIIDRKRKILEIYKEKRNRAFCKLRLLEKRLMFESDTYFIESLEKKLFMHKIYFNRINKRISSLKLTPSYNQLAGILKIPKGTVGTGLRWIKEISKKALIKI